MSRDFSWFLLLRVSVCVIQDPSNNTGSSTFLYEITVDVHRRFGSSFFVFDCSVDFGRGVFGFFRRKLVLVILQFEHEKSQSFRPVCVRVRDSTFQRMRVKKRRRTNKLTFITNVSGTIYTQTHMCVHLYVEIPPNPFVTTTKDRPLVLDLFSV